jgi:hypothetical protein
LSAKNFYFISDEEFRSRLIAAREYRHLTVEELSRMMNMPAVSVEGWLTGETAPRRVGRETLLRAIE